LRPFRLASRAVTSGEWLEFIADGGYRNPQLWLSDGWDAVCAQHWEAPLYWERRDQEWRQYTMSGTRRVEPGEPVCHVSYYEADAYARWAGARLPLEEEWEIAAEKNPSRGIMLEDGVFHPRRASGNLALGGERAQASLGDDRGERAPTLLQMFGDVWESLRRLSRIPSGCGRARRVQRQIHVQPVGAARRIVRHALEPHPRQLSKLFPAAGAVAIFRSTACARYRLTSNECPKSRLMCGPA